MVDGPPALPDLLVAVVARWTVSEVVSVQLDKPPPVTGVGTEAFTGAQAVHEHRGTKNVCVTVMIPDLTHSPDPAGDVLYWLLSLHDHKGWVLQSDPRQVRVGSVPETRQVKAFHCG